MLTSSFDSDDDSDDDDFLDTTSESSDENQSGGAQYKVKSYYINRLKQYDLNYLYFNLFYGRQTKKGQKNIQDTVIQKYAQHQKNKKDNL